MNRVTTSSTWTRHIGLTQQLCCWCTIFLTTLATPLSALTITEIHYNPHGDDSLEFLEIYNEGSIVEDMSGFFFSDGIEFVFPEDYFLPARSYIVLAVNPDALKERYGIENIAPEAFSGRLDNTGERLRLVSHTGSEIVQVRYNDRGKWPASANGTGHTLSLRSPLLDCRSPDNWVRSAQRGGTPGKENFLPRELFNTEGLPSKQVWRYAKGWDPVAQTMAEFSDPPEAWRTADFDDTAWAEGKAPIGFGKDEIKTSLDDMVKNYFAFAMRHKFTLEPALLDQATSLILKLTVDDGAVVWLNGVEVARVSIAGEAPGDPAPVDQASETSNEFSHVHEIFVSKDLVHKGENLLAVQVHNRTLRSRDAAFDMAISYANVRAFAPPPAPTVVFNEISISASSNERWVELYNLTAAAVDLSEHSLTDSPDKPRKYTFPPGTSIPAQGFLYVGEGDLGFPLEVPDVSVYLYDPSAEIVTDAANVSTVSEPSPTSRCRLPDGRGRWATSTILTPGLANDAAIETGVVINEIHYRPLLMDDDGAPLSDTDHGEYVELFNRTEDRTISLEGLRFAAGIRFEFGAQHQIPPGGYLVVARDPEYVRETYGLDETIVVGVPKDATADERDGFGTLANGGEAIRLEDSLGNVVDEVKYFDGGDWDSSADGDGSSLELVDPFQDNAVGFAWRGSRESHKAPWVEINYTANFFTNVPPGVVEPEIHLYLLSSGEALLDDVSLKSGDTELVPNGGFEEDTAPWRLWGNHVRSFRTTTEAKVGAACLHLVATGGGNNKVDRVEVDTQDIPVGEVTVRLWARWLGGANAFHISGHNNVFGKTVWLPVPVKTGTPGKENSVRAALREETGDDNLGPTISAVRHTPPVPLPNESITFHANVSAAAGVKSVVVSYKLDEANAVRKATLVDDGLNGDGSPGDGHYAVLVPGFSEARVVNFWMEAEDSTGRVTVYPHGAPEHSLSLMIDVPLESTVHRYRVVMNGETKREFYSRLVLSKDPLPGTFVFEEERVFYDVGLRARGRGIPNSFRVRFPSDNVFRRTAKRLNVNRSGIIRHENVAYQLVRKASAPGSITPHTAEYEFAVVKLNADVHSEPTMAEVRAVDRAYAEYNWPTDADGRFWKVNRKHGFDDVGDLVEARFARFRLYTNGPYPNTPSKENHRFYYLPRVNKNLDTFDPLIDLLTLVDPSTRPLEIQTKLEEIMNVEAVLRTFIPRVLAGDFDTLDLWLEGGQNAYFYYAPIEGSFYLCPWDMDSSFVFSSYRDHTFMLEPIFPEEGLGRLVRLPKFRRLYMSIMREILDGPWAEPYIERYADAVAQTTTGVNEPGVVLDWIGPRRQFAEQFLRSGTVPFAVTSDSPVFTHAETITIEGKAPLEVRQIVVTVNDGDPAGADLRWTVSGRRMPTAWAFDLGGLVPGKNTVELIAFSRSGDLIGTASLVAHLSGAGARTFVRGDTNDDGRLNITDAVGILRFLLEGAQHSCPDATDVNDDGVTNITDAIRLVDYLYARGEAPSAPFPDPGHDPTGDGLPCIPSAEE